MFDIICLPGVRFDAQGRPEGGVGGGGVYLMGPTPTLPLVRAVPSGFIFEGRRGDVAAHLEGAEDFYQGEVTPGLLTDLS